MYVSVLVLDIRSEWHCTSTSPCRKFQRGGQKRTEFEFEYDEDSEISYLTSTDSVEDLGKEAL